MILFKKAKELSKYLQERHKTGLRAGFVPTMGALHEGHISLLREAKADNEIAVVSIFVNPTQFNDPADFEKYPITLEKDILVLEEANCDVLFLPSVVEMYPDGPHVGRQYELGTLETILEGQYRPGHFQGVCTIVHRLLNIVLPDQLYMGQKDYQQCMVVRRLLEITGLSDRVKLKISPTLREQSGLAMSSRNMRLSENEKHHALAIANALQLINTNWRETDLAVLKQEAWGTLVQKGLKPDYVEIADADTLILTDKFDGKQRLVALIAAFMNQVRLIDNMLLK